VKSKILNQFAKLFGKKSASGCFEGSTRDLKAIWHIKYLLFDYFINVMASGQQFALPLLILMNRQIFSASLNERVSASQYKF